MTCQNAIVVGAGRAMAGLARVALLCALIGHGARPQSLPPRRRRTTIASRGSPIRSRCWRIIRSLSSRCARPARFEAAALVDQAAGRPRRPRLAIFVQRPRHCRNPQSPARQRDRDHRRPSRGASTMAKAGTRRSRPAWPFNARPRRTRSSTQHIGQVVDPFLTALRPHVGLVLYSLPGKEDPIRKQMYRSFRGQPTAEDRRQGGEQLDGPPGRLRVSRRAAADASC